MLGEIAVKAELVMAKTGTTPAEIAKRIKEAGERAKAEAEARRTKEPPKKPGPREIGGQEGPDPTRYGDWEKKGICSDF